MARSATAACSLASAPDAHSESMIPDLRGLGLRREVLEKSSLAIIEVDMERRVRYANPAAIRMLGAPADYLGLSLDSVFVDDASQKVIDQEIERRRAGLIGNYRITARRLSDRREIPIEITGLPITDDDGKVVIALGLFRSLEQQELSAAISQLGRPDQTPEELLRELAATLKRSIPFERMSVSRMSSDTSHVNRFFSSAQDGPALRYKRWWALTDAMRQWYATPGSNVIVDLEKFFENPVWAPYRKDRAVEELFRAGIKSVLRRDVRRDGRAVCSITLMSLELDGFTEEQKELFMSAPVGSVVLQAYERFEKTRVAQRLDLLKNLNRCTTVVDACSMLATRLVDIFDWSHVSIFRVDRTAGVVRLLAQHSGETDPIRLPASYEQLLGVGILGRVVATGEVQNIGNVKDDPDYIRGVRSGHVTSELCVPVRSEGESEVRWIINVEATQESAFASDEVMALQEVAEEVGGLMQRIADLFFLTQCFEHASEAIFVTDARLNLRCVNPAAAHLLGFKETSKVKGNICDYLVEPAACTRLSAPVAGDLGEFLVKQASATRGKTKSKSAPVPVFVSRRDFPEGLSGSIFIARDTSTMRKTVQAGILEKAAYSVAAETCTPLSAAMAELESLCGTFEHKQSIHRVLRQLGRVQQGYRRLAMFNPDARPKTSILAPLNLQCELEAHARNLAASDRISVTPAVPGTVPVIQGDHFQIGFVLETLLVAMLRYAPESEPVTATVSVADGTVKIRLRGYLDAGIPEQQLDAPWVQSDADMAIAKPLIDEFVGNHKGTWVGAVGRDHHAEINMHFPLSER